LNCLHCFGGDQGALGGFRQNHVFPIFETISILWRLLARFLNKLCQTGQFIKASDLKHLHSFILIFSIAGPDTASKKKDIWQVFCLIIKEQPNENKPTIYKYFLFIISYIVGAVTTSISAS
jgi:hypothetical protein